MPSVRQLEYLIALSETRHFRHAAEKIGVRQPTLSAQLSALEETLGAQLVERSRSRVILTPIGNEVEAIARRVVSDVQEIRDVACGRRGELSGVTRLGLPPTIGPYLLPLIVPKIQKKYPKLQLYVREEMPQSLPRRLQEGHHDVIVTPMPMHAHDLESVPLFREPLYLAIPSDSELASKEKIEHRDLRGLSMLTLEEGHQLREQVEVICAEFGADLLTNFEGTSLDTLRHMVGMGMGLAFLPGLYVHTTLDKESAVKIRELKGRALHRTIGLVWRKTTSRKVEFAELGDNIRMTLKGKIPSITILSS